MTTPIRPGPTTAPPAPTSRSPQALAAQRAFFQAAMDRASAATTPSAPVKPQAATAPPPSAPTARVQTAAASPTESPEPVSRPGRYLDIRV